MALVDSDTLWARDVKRQVLKPFADRRIGGVGTRQNVHNPENAWQHINDMYLDYRYFDEIASQTRVGKAVSCLSGRTAVYRRDLLLKISHDFMNERFLGLPCNSGEDKRLTSLTLKAGYLTYMQRTARVWSTFPAGTTMFFKQRLRWSRNTWRSDLRALSRPWCLPPSILRYTMMDKGLSGFTLLLGPAFMVHALINQNWVFAAVLAGWWQLSRSAKLLPHLRRRPSSFLFIPGYVFVSWIMAIIKLQALVTIRRQRWLTRQVAVENGQVVRTTGADTAADPAVAQAPQGAPVPVGAMNGMHGLMSATMPIRPHGGPQLTPGQPLPAGAVRRAPGPRAPAGFADRAVDTGPRAAPPVRGGSADVAGQRDRAPADHQQRTGAHRAARPPRRARSAHREQAVRGIGNPAAPGRRRTEGRRVSPAGGRRLLLAGALVAVTAVLIPVGVAAAAPGVSGISAQGPTNGNDNSSNNNNNRQQQQQAATGSNSRPPNKPLNRPPSRPPPSRRRPRKLRRRPRRRPPRRRPRRRPRRKRRRRPKRRPRRRPRRRRRPSPPRRPRRPRRPLSGPRRAQRAAVTWNRRGKPQKLVIVRATSIDSVSGGNLVQRVVRNGRTLSLGALDAAIPSSWMAVDGDTAQLRTAVVLTPGTLLNVEGVKTLQLAGGPDINDAAFLYTGSGRIQLRNVTVTSIDPTSGQAVGADLAGRPYIKVSDQGRLDASDSVLSDLGTKPTGDAQGSPAIAFGRGSTGTLNGVTLQRNSTGLSLASSQGVRLQDVTVSESDENGIVLRGDRATVLSGVKAERNGDNGVLVSGDPGARPITGISTTGNKSYGVSITGQKNVEIRDLTLSGDGLGGLELNRTTDSKVRGITATNEPYGVFLHVNSVNMSLDGLTITGGRSGIVAEKTTKSLQVTGSTIDSTRVAGIAIGGKGTQIDGLTVKNSRTGVRVERGAGDVAANNVTLIGGDDGLVTSGGSTGVVVKNLTTDGVDNALRNLSSGMQISGGTIRGGRTGMDLQAGTTVDGIQVGLTTTGIRARAAEPIALDGVTVDAVSVGVESQPGTAVTLRDSSVHALEAVRGQVTLLGNTDLSLPPLNFLGAIGLPLILLAVVLEVAHLLRSRRFGPTRRALPPPVPVGAG